MNIVILGSSGSIGTQCLSLLKDHPEHKVIGLSVKSKIELLKEQAKEWQAPKLCVYEEALAEKLSTDLDMPVSSGMEGLIELATLPEADMVVIALVGMIGILPTISAIKAGKKIALANKETLVCAGHLIMPMLSEYRAKLFPIDSEHSAIWQCLRGEEEKSVESLLLTASGGPFFGLKKEEMEGKTKADALKHPNWSMGQKITIDSATMVNKGLEMMEAHWLFNIPMEKIQVVIQRESILHSAVVFQDGAVKGQMGVPDMRLPIAYALFQEERECYREQRIDFKRLNKFKKGEYIPIEEVIKDFNWLDLQIAIKEQAPNIELCYLVRAYGSTYFKIITANELKELDNAGKLDNLFISPLFKILD